MQYYIYIPVARIYRCVIGVCMIMYDYVYVNSWWLRTFPSRFELQCTCSTPGGPVNPTASGWIVEGLGWCPFTGRKLESCRTGFPCLLWRSSTLKNPTVFFSVVLRELIEWFWARFILLHSSFKFVLENCAVTAQSQVLVPGSLFIGYLLFPLQGFVWFGAQIFTRCRVHQARWPTSLYYTLHL